jgi:hypothetical protein
VVDDTQQVLKGAPRETLLEDNYVPSTLGRPWPWVLKSPGRIGSLALIKSVEDGEGLCTMHAERAWPGMTYGTQLPVPKVQTHGAPDHFK